MLRASEKDLPVPTQRKPLLTVRQKVAKGLSEFSMSHTTTEEKCGMDFSPSSGEATSGEKKFPYESRVAEPRVTNREIYHATFLLSGGVP